MIVYVSSPYSGDITTNIAKARRYCRFVADKGHTPLAPHLLLPQFMNEKTERDMAMHMALEILAMCDAIWIFGRDMTTGMKAEFDRALNMEAMDIEFITDKEVER
jgi:hypothetical protein